MFASLRNKFSNCRTCSLRFDIEENTIIEAFVRFRFASVAITTLYNVNSVLLDFHEIESFSGQFCAFFSNTKY
jgi:hypothetical protein